MKRIKDYEDTATYLFLADDGQDSFMNCGSQVTDSAERLPLPHLWRAATLFPVRRLCIAYTLVQVCDSDDDEVAVMFVIYVV